MESKAEKKPEIRAVASSTPKRHKKPSAAATYPSLDDLRPFYKSIQWSADGTTVIASSSSNRICSYVLPADLLEPRVDGPVELAAQGTLSLPEPTQAVSPCPYYSLAHPSTQTVLVACRDHPLQLHSAFPGGGAIPQPPAAAASDRDGDGGGDEASMGDDDGPARELYSSSLCSSSGASSPCSPRHSSPDLGPQSHHQPPVASYPLIKRETEAYITPSSLIWPAPGTHFTAGAANVIAHFDAARPGEPPVLRIATIPSARHIAKGSGVGMRGTVSALAAQPGSGAWPGSSTGLVAAGTRTRWVGLYDVSRSGSCVATWGLPAASSGPAHGTGVVQTVWSPCGRYLLINERRSSRLAVYDVRVTGRLLGFLSGRHAPDSNQCLGCDVFPGRADGQFEVWSGTADGRVVAWNGVDADAMGGGDHTSNDCAHREVSPSWSWQAHAQQSAVGCVALHPSGSVLATCAGSWEVVDVDDESDDLSETLNASPRHGGRQRVRITDDTTLAIWAISAGTDA